MKAVRFEDPAKEIRVGSLEDDGVVHDAGPAGPRGFVASDEAWDALASGSGRVYRRDETTTGKRYVRSRSIGRHRDEVGICANRDRGGNGVRRGAHHQHAVRAMTCDVRARAIGKKRDRPGA